MVTPPQGTIAFAIAGPIARTDLPGLCDRICALLEQSGAGVALCDVSGVEVDAVTVDALARLQVAARRHGCQVRLRGASSSLVDLLAFMGLSDVLPGDLCSQAVGQAEQREEGVGVEEERQLGDPPVRHVDDL